MVVAESHKHKYTHHANAHQATASCQPHACACVCLCVCVPARSHVSTERVRLIRTHIRLSYCCMCVVRWLATTILHICAQRADIIMNGRICICTLYILCRRANESHCALRGQTWRPHTPSERREVGRADRECDCIVDCAVRARVRVLFAHRRTHTVLR